MSDVKGDMKFPVTCKACGNVEDQDLVDLVLRFVAAQEECFDALLPIHVPAKWKEAYVAMHNRAQDDCGTVAGPERPSLGACAILSDELSRRAQSFGHEHRDCNPNGANVMNAVFRLLSDVRRETVEACANVASIPVLRDEPHRIVRNIRNLADMSAETIAKLASDTAEEKP